MKGDLRIAMWTGFFVFLGCLALIAITVALGQKSQLFEDTFALKTTFNNVMGLSNGAVVRVAGVNVGNVADVQLPENIAQKRVTVTLSINDRYRDRIRRDSPANIQTLGPLGDKYIEIGLGAGAEPPVKDGDFITGVDPIDYYVLISRARGALERAIAGIDSFSNILAQVEKGKTLANLERITAVTADVVERVEKGPGLAHKLVYDETFAKAAEDLRAATQTVREATDRAKRGEGPLGLLLKGEAVNESVLALRDAARSLRGILQQIETGDNAVHAMIYDPAERQTLTDIRAAAARLEKVMARVDQGEGSLGLLVNDPAVWESLRRLLGGVERSRIMRSIIESSIEKGAAAEKGAAQK